MEFTTQEQALITKIKSDAEALIQEKTNGLMTETRFNEKLNELKIKKKENNFFRAVFLNLITIIFIIILAFLFKKQKNKNQIQRDRK